MTKVIVTNAAGLAPLAAAASGSAAATVFVVMRWRAEPGVEASVKTQPRS